MTSNKPACFKCKFFKSRPTEPGGKAKCTKYVRGIPNKIYWESSKCPKVGVK